MDVNRVGPREPGRGDGNDTIRFRNGRSALALLRVGDALIVNELFAIAQECTAARRVYRDVLELYPKLQLRATERDSLLGQMSLLGSQLNQCEAFLQRPFADAG